jgi:membrane dipeptidase
LIQSAAAQAVFDGHNDTLIHPDAGRFVGGGSGAHVDLPRMRAGGMRGGIFAVFTGSPDGRGPRLGRDDGGVEFGHPQPLDQPTAAGFATRVAGRLFALEQDGHVRVARTAGDLDAALADPNGPPAAVLHLEGAEAIDPGLQALDTWYAAGLRSLGPVWSRVNAFGTGVPFVFPSSPDLGPGLTAAGVALVRRCAELGVAVDLSHLNEAGFWDIARLEAGPIVVSHAGAHALAPCSRNLTDAQLDAVAGSGGLVGIVFAAPFLRADFADVADTPLELIVTHARYVADRIGVEHVAFGSDFDGATIPAALGDVAGLPLLLEAMRTAGGFGDRELEQITWRNWRRVLGDWWRS